MENDYVKLYRDYSNVEIREWLSNIGSEIEFWCRWFETKGLQWPEEFVKQTASSRDLPNYLEELFPANIESSRRILDIASGPISVIGLGAEKNQKHELNCFDPLSEVYNALLSRYGFEYLPKIKFGLSEFINSYTDNSSYDLVFCRNGLDHTFDPFRSLVACLQLLAPEGVLVLEHDENEAEFQNYHGLHYWNFEIEKGNLIFWSKNSRINVNESLKGIASIENQLLPGDRRGVRSTIRLSNYENLEVPKLGKIEKAYIEEGISEILSRVVREINSRG